MRFELFVASRYLRTKRRQVEALSGRERGAVEREPAAKILRRSRRTYIR